MDDLRQDFVWVLEKKPPRPHQTHESTHCPEPRLGRAAMALTSNCPQFVSPELHHRPFSWCWGYIQGSLQGLAKIKSKPGRT